VLLTRLISYVRYRVPSGSALVLYLPSSQLPQWQLHQIYSKPLRKPSVQALCQLDIGARRYNDPGRDIPVNRLRI
jgi:hypothetical protein